MKKSFQTKILSMMVPFLLMLVAVFRVYNFEQSIQFDSDFGRDTLFAVRILTEKPTLLGAQASVGGFYLGPLYFYGIAAIFSIFQFTPQIVSLAFAGMNVLAAYLGYRMLSKYVAQKAGFLFLILFGIQPLLVGASRGATHQPMLPLITMLVVWMLIRARENKAWYWQLLSGMTFGLFFHIHFSSLLLVPGYFGAVWLWSKGSIIHKIRQVILHTLGMFIMVSPLLLFDLRHGFITSKAFFAYLTASASGKAIAQAFPHWTMQEKITHILSFFASQVVLQIASVLLACFGLVIAIQKKKKEINLISLITLLFFSVCLFLLLYKGYLFTYYLIIPCTLGVLWLSACLGRLRNSLIATLLVLCIAIASFAQLQSFYRPTYRTITNLSRVTHEIEAHIERTKQRNFTIFKDSADGLTGLGYEYRFLLQRDGYTPVHELAYQDADVLYVIREDGTSDPLTLGNWEVRQFSPKSVEEVATLSILDKQICIFALKK